MADVCRKSSSDRKMPPERRTGGGKNPKKRILSQATKPRLSSSVAGA
jgi:hypothetical protein